MASNNPEAAENAGSELPEWEVKLARARTYKTEGNACFKARTIKQAIGKYHRALLYLRGIEEGQRKMMSMLTGEADTTSEQLSDEVKAEIQTLKNDCYNNLSACLLQGPEPPYGKIVQYCDNVLDVQPGNTKALFRKGKSLYHLKDIGSALEVLRQAQNQPDGQKDANIRKYIALCEKEEVRQDKNMKATYKEMFAKLSSEDS